jgi:AcrR family transcriptional regulator
VDATLALLAEGSVSGLTVEGIAARAGVGKTTIYRRWSSKLPLVVAAIRALPELKVPETGTLRGDLRQILSALVKILRTSPLGPVLLHVAAESGTDPELRDAISEHLALRRAPLLEVSRRALARGELPAGSDPDTLTELLTGPIVNRLLFSTGPVDGRFIDVVIATVLEGNATMARQRRKRRSSQSQPRVPNRRTAAMERPFTPVTDSARRTTAQLRS